MQETQEIWVWSLGQEDHLEKEMTPHSSILAWKIPQTEEPGGLRVAKSLRHDWAHTHTHSLLYFIYLLYLRANKKWDANYIWVIIFFSNLDSGEKI